MREKSSLKRAERRSVLNLAFEHTRENRTAHLAGNTDIEVCPMAYELHPDLGSPFSDIYRAPGTPRRTLPRTPPIFGDTLGDTPGTLRARRARETPVAGRRDRKPDSDTNGWCIHCFQPEGRAYPLARNQLYSHRSQFPRKISMYWHQGCVNAAREGRRCGYICFQNNFSKIFEVVAQVRIQAPHVFVQDLRS